MARKSRKSKRSLFGGSKRSRKSSKSSGLLGKVGSAVGLGKGKSGVKRRKPSLKSLATELARIKLKRKIAKERLKVM